MNQLLDNLKIITVIAVLLLSPFLVNQAFAELTFDSVVKSADETVNNSITFQNDDELFFTCNANKTYSVLLNLFLSSDGGAGFKTQWTLPTGATGSISAGQLNSGVSQLTQDITISDSHLVSGTDQKILTFYGKIKTSSTSGVCQLQWSQNSQTVADTIVEEGSLLRVYESGATATVPVAPLGNGTGSVVFAKVVKSVDESVTNSVTQQNDDELKFQANANNVYNLRLSLWWDGSGISDLDTSFTVPSGATIRVTSSDFRSSEGQVTQDGTTEIFHDAGATTFNHNIFDAIITMGSTSGTVNFLFAQSVSDGTPTTVLKGSSIVVYEEGADSGTDSIGLLHTKVVKSVDETIFNLNVLQDDDELFFICEANTVYIGRLSLFTEITFTADWKEAWTIPTGATAFVLDDVMRFSDSQTMRDATVSHFQNGGLLTQPQNTAGDVLFNIGSTTGICQFQWSQFNSEASDARMKAGSTLLVYEQGTSTVSDLQGEQGIQGEKGDKGDTGATGSAGTGGGGVGVGSPVAPAPALSETELVELVLAQLTPVEPTIFSPIVEPLESIVQTFFEFAVVDTSLDQLVLNSFVQNERLGIRWSSGQDIVILSAIPATSPFQITFEAFPVAKQGSGAVISTDFLSYNLQVPSVQCSLQITTNCVEKVRYEIPVTINAVIGDSQVSDTGTITVDLVDEFLDPILLILLATFAIPIIGIIIQKSRGRSSSVPARRVFQ